MQGSKKIYVTLSIIIVLIVLGNLRYFPFSITKLSKGNTITIQQISLYENGVLVKTIDDENANIPAIIGKIADCKIRRPLFPCINSKGQNNYITLQYSVVSDDNLPLLADTFIVYDDGFYRDTIAVVYPIWKRDVEMYEFIYKIVNATD